LKFVIQYLKTRFSCFPKEPKCGYKQVLDKELDNKQVLDKEVVHKK